MSQEIPTPKDPLEEVRQIHRALWENAKPPVSEKEIQQRFLLERLRTLSLDLLLQGVTSAIVEGAFLIWWLKVACLNHGFAEGGFERCLARIGPMMKQIGDILDRLGHEIQDDGPLPELERLAQKLEEARDIFGGWGRSWPKSREEGDAQTELAYQRIQPALLEWIDAGVSPAMIERMLFYFWFRTTAINRDLKEFFFQKLERNWDVVMAHVNQNLDEQAASDRQQN